MRREKEREGEGRREGKRNGRKIDRNGISYFRSCFTCRHDAVERVRLKVACCALMLTCCAQRERKFMGTYSQQTAAT